MHSPAPPLGQHRKPHARLGLRKKKGSECVEFIIADVLVTPVDGQNQIVRSIVIGSVDEERVLDPRSTSPASALARLPLGSLATG
jgi:hypothetical protein